MTGEHETPGAEPQLHRLCVFDLSLDCGHIVTVACDGWYPVSVSCCDRLGGTVLRGVYRPFDSHVEYANVLSERYEHRPHGSPPEPTRLLGRRPRTDEPQQLDQPHHRWVEPNAGRFPARVGVAWDLDAAAPPAAQP